MPCSKRIGRDCQTLLLVLTLVMSIGQMAEAQIDNAPTPETLPILRTTLRKSCQADIDTFIRTISPMLLEVSGSLKVFAEQWEGDSLLQKCYSTDECAQYGFPNFYFYDGGFGARSMRQNAYQMPRYWMYEDYAPGIPADLLPDSFVQLHTTQLLPALREAQIETEDTPYMINQCATVDTSVSADCCYSFLYRYEFHGIPCYPFMINLPSRGTYSFNPSVHVMHNEEGLLCVFAGYVLDIVTETEPQALLSSEQAINIAVGRKQNLLGVEMPALQGVSLQYAPLPYVGGDITRDVDLVPAWVVCFEHSGGVRETLLVDAITGRIIE